MKTLSNCPICSNNDFSKVYSCKDHSTSKESFTIVNCNACNFTFTNPRPEDESLDKYYLSENYISHTNSKTNLFEKLYQIVRKIAIKQKLSLLNKFSNSKIHLDIGCGTGDFLNACKAVGYKAKGIEPSDIARNKAIEHFDLDVSKNTDLSQFENKEFETISMWHVLEHISKLNDTVKHFARILKEEGIVIIAVPNLKSWDANYYKEYWAAWDVPIHLWHFSKNSINKLFEKHGFTLIKTKPMIFDSFYVSVLSEEYKTGKKNLVKGFLIGLISNLVGICTKKGYSSTIYVFKNEKKLK